ncbi:hypothetical protein MLD38_027880 [Melastoma candidum]|uniref:Uncharacterized protein n=1 Tax=Melastoma candidum TaxID=119954 RepID=A0ACB9MZW5_9MYRT|nr:hypothetical protein MLD38_027880 [Melastoma candidum]
MEEGGVPLASTSLLIFQQHGGAIRKLNGGELAVVPNQIRPRMEEGGVPFASTRAFELFSGNSFFLIDYLLIFQQHGGAIRKLNGLDLLTFFLFFCHACSLIIIFGRTYMMKWIMEKDTETLS